jgi:hypothetical protein
VGNLYAYIDYAAGYNHSWLCENFVDDFARRNPDDKAQACRVDLIIVADKGRNTFSSLLVGSVTEELFNQDLKMPLWIVKH